MFVCQYFKWFFNLFSKRTFGSSRPVAVNRTFILFSQDAPDVYSDRVGLTFSQVKKSFPPSDWIPCIACEGKHESTAWSMMRSTPVSIVLRMCGITLGLGESLCLGWVEGYTFAGWGGMLGLGEGVHLAIRSGPPQTDPHKWTSTSKTFTSGPQPGTSHTPLIWVQVYSPYSTPGMQPVPLVSFPCPRCMSLIEKYACIFLFTWCSNCNH